MPTKKKKIEALKKGQRVKLLANEEEGWDEEFGEVEEYEKDNDIYCVRVDKKYRVKGDDGLREIMRKFLEPI
jgi:hypothetical protein